jgi:hypothetical protein
MIRKSLKFLLVVGGLLAAVLLYSGLEESPRSVVAEFRDEICDFGHELRAVVQDISGSVREVAEDLNAELKEIDPKVVVKPTPTRAAPSKSTKSPRGSVVIIGPDGTRRPYPPTSLSTPAPRWGIRLEEGEFGKTPESAKEKIIEKALIRIANWVREETRLSARIEPGRLISAELLRQQAWLAAPPSIKLARTIPMGNEQVHLYGAEVVVELLPETRELLINHALALQHRERQAAMLARSWWVGKGVLSLLVLALGSLTYCLTDDRTQGYYKKRIAISVALGVAVVLSGLWLLVPTFL